MDRAKHNQSPQGGTARILVELLEVAITSIVFLKGVYPSGAFERRRYMNLVVHRARHPQLRDYIHTAVRGLLPFIKKCKDAENPRSPNRSTILRRQNTKSATTPN
ncbi:HORMA domain containing protein [Parasponia andersonii]|uniref:HORMA domain containing protein n=1 Tax=Parasponia andersonii TaxID=3476 RepID=A0A2P5DLJ3_PARAD|nr:HORMA domain containing protein [Parasponia andersonii]